MALSGVGRGMRGRDDGGDLTNEQYNPIWKFHNELPLNTKCIPKKKISIPLWEKLEHQLRGRFVLFTN
jgi:hypothetical protein